MTVMYVIEVAPLLRGGQVDSLSYYSATDYAPGTLLTIPVRNKEVKGLVIGSKGLSAAKTAVRAATFSLKRLPAQNNPQVLSPILVQTAQILAEKLPATFGAILFTLLPPEVKNGDEILPAYSDQVGQHNESLVSVLTATKEDRYLTYKRRIREAFAHRGSVVFVAATNEGAAQAADELLGGIAERSVVLSGDIPKRALHKAYQAAADLSTAKLIITTPTRAFIDRPDITDVIIENASSSHYRSRVRPYLDLKTTLLLHSQLSGRRVLLGDLVHRSEDEHRRRLEIYQTEGEEPHRISLISEMRVIEQLDKPSAETPFELLSGDLLQSLTNTLKEKKNAFIYSARRGLSPVVACGDCGFIFRCPDSGAPYSLFRTTKDGEEKRWFLSPTSGRRVRAADTCSECGSWRLRERGIGIQNIHDELKKFFPAEKIFVFDHATATTAAKARVIIGNFSTTKGAILLGTSMALPYLEKFVAMSAVVSLDAVRSIPSWRVDEATFSLLMRLREISIEQVLVQTRTESDELLSLAGSGAVDKFFTEELSLREALHYPPFQTIVHLTIAGTLPSVRQLEANISPALEPFGFSFYSAPDSVPNKTTRYALCRLEGTKSISPELVNVLKSLPMSVRVELNPDRIV